MIVLRILTSWLSLSVYESSLTYLFLGTGFFFFSNGDSPELNTGVNSFYRSLSPMSIEESFLRKPSLEGSTSRAIRCIASWYSFDTSRARSLEE